MSNIQNNPQIEKNDNDSPTLSKQNNEIREINKNLMKCEESNESNTMAVKRKRVHENDKTKTKDRQHPTDMNTVSYLQCNTNTLFVGGLHRSITDAHLHKLFQPYGTVERVFQVFHKQSETTHRPGLAGKPKGYAFVEYDSISSAQSAMKHLDGRLLLKRTLIVRPAHSKSLSTSDSSSLEVIKKKENHPTNLQNIQKETSELELKIQEVKKAIEAKKKRQKC